MLALISEKIVSILLLFMCFELVLLLIFVGYLAVEVNELNWNVAKILMIKEDEDDECHDHERDLRI